MAREARRRFGHTHFYGHKTGVFLHHKNSFSYCYCFHRYAASHLDTNEDSCKVAAQSEHRHLQDIVFNLLMLIFSTNTWLGLTTNKLN